MCGLLSTSRTSTMGACSRQKCKQLEAWAIEEHLDLVESMWHCYCRTTQPFEDSTSQLAEFVSNRAPHSIVCVPVEKHDFDLLFHLVFHQEAKQCTSVRLSHNAMVCIDEKEMKLTSS
ncbi:hypothetical protein OPV22_032114 [Ensete ventricosum]|uniref:Uncharacterized protein n=1 Tax=Ensete ventricosum TaxID=4639 RepID=A0AAV8PQQ6_ENSVE|nr:hypothetical protein OPV22_032114 [Ensete ventricosum]